MGVDIIFYRTKKNIFDKVVEDNSNDKDIDWTSLEPYEINYACGRHFTYDFLVENFGGNTLSEFTPKHIAIIKDKAESVVNKWRVHNEEICTIPVLLLEKYLKEAKENEEQVITFNISDYTPDSEYIDTTDYYQAQDIIDTDWHTKEDEVIWFLNSY